MPSDSRNDAVLRAGSQLGMQQSSACCRELSSAEQMNEDADEPPLGLPKHNQPARVQFTLDPSKTPSSSSASTVTMIKTPALFAVDAATTSEGSDHSDCEEHRITSSRPSALSPLVLAHSAVSSSSSSTSASAAISAAVDDSSLSPLPSPRSPPSDDLASSSSDESSSDSSPLRSRVRTDGSLGDVDDDDDDEYDDEYDPSAPLTVLPKFGPSLSHVNPKLEARVSRTGSGIFAVQRIEAGETLVVWTGRIITDEEALTIVDTPEGHYLLQIGDGFYQCPLQRVREAADFTNHSCNPNAGFGKNSPVLLSAIRPLEVGDEVLFDYGMCETDERLWHPMRCECGAPQCRKWITANDWKLYPELWTRYDGFWSPHVQARVDRLLGRPNAHAARQARAVYEQQHAVSTAPPLNVDAASEVVAEAAKEEQQAAEVVAALQPHAAPQAAVVAQKAEEKQLALVADASAPALPPADVLTSWLDTALSWFGLMRTSAVATAATTTAAAAAAAARA